MSSFNDEQLLRLVNNTAIENGYDPNDFTGGSVQVTTAYNHKISNFKVLMYFGYDKNKHPVTLTKEIHKDVYLIWMRAIMAKVASLEVGSTGDHIDELNRLMNSDVPQKEKRTKKEKKVKDIGKEVIGKEVIGIGRGRAVDSANYRATVRANNSETTEQAERISDHLHKSILRYKPNFVKKGSWVKDIELAIRVDGRTEQELMACIDWIHTTKEGNFWIPNIMSGKKLRDKFDVMEAQMTTRSKARGSLMDNIYDNGLSARELLEKMEERDEQ